ncbi:MAG TPA: LysM peptidoglycan-binding domain-containing protein [Gallionellaceae bacterium]|nr:LysM peptidoglycan-binding domain-containing protein [Gallionellaceae bacterium]
MQKLIIALICCLLPALTFADTLSIRDNAPDHYVVVKGDTLWDISAKFFNDPWKWPQIWGLNRDSIKNPHWIYPGDVVLLDRTSATLRVEGGTATPLNAESGLAAAQPPSQTEKIAVEQPETGAVTKLSPRARVEAGEHDAISSIPLRDVEPFLKKPLVIEEGDLDKAPVIVAGYEERSLLGNSDIAYVKGLPADKGLVWQIYRPGKALVDPVSDKVLGYEAVYLGNARVEKIDDLSTVRIFGAKEEIYPGDHLVLAANGFPDNFIPRAPDSEISARVISIVNGVSMAGQKAVVVINKGRRDGIQNGHVLALYRKGEKVNGNELPNMRYGLLFVFRTFEKLSYALVMQTQLPVELLDVAQTP